MIGLTLFVLLLLVYFLISAAVIYHIWRYSPERDRAVVLIIVYVVVSIFLLLLAISDFIKIDWKGIMQ